MLEIILCLFIGRAYSQLCNRFNRSNQGFFILIGILAYFVGLVAFMVILNLTGLLGDMDSMFMGVLTSFMGMPVGLLCTWLLYINLKKRWEKEVIEDESILDDIPEP